MVDKLIDRIVALENPVCVGLDTKFEYIPKEFVKGILKDPLIFAANNIWTYNKQLIDALADIVPAVKVQSAYYEMYGPAGVVALYDTIQYAKKQGLLVIADVKRNDIGATAEAYATAYLGKTSVKEEHAAAFDADFVTVNGYLGTDGIQPFVDCCKREDKGIFVLVKTSNQSSGEFQDLVCDGQTIYEHMAQKVEQWGSELIGKHGYSSVGAVIGATYPEQAKKLRNKHPHMFVLIPGYGAQGGSAQGLVPNFDSNGLGGIVNNSRAILTAHQNEVYQGLSFDMAARQAVLDMQRDILETFDKNQISYK